MAEDEAQHDEVTMPADPFPVLVEKIASLDARIVAIEGKLDEIEKKVELYLAHPPMTASNTLEAKMAHLFAGLSHLLPPMKD